MYSLSFVMVMMTVRHVSFVDFPTLSLGLLISGVSPQSNLQVGKKRRNKRSLFGAHNRSIIAVLIDRLI